MVASGRCTGRLEIFNPSKAWGLVTSWTKWRSIYKRLVPSSLWPTRCSDQILSKSVFGPWLLKILLNLAFSFSLFCFFFSRYLFFWLLFRFRVFLRRCCLCFGFFSSFYRCLFSYGSYRFFFFNLFLCNFFNVFYWGYILFIIICSTICSLSYSCFFTR